MAILLDRRKNLVSAKQCDLWRLSKNGLRKCFPWLYGVLIKVRYGSPSILAILESLLFAKVLNPVCYYESSLLAKCSLAIHMDVTCRKVVPSFNKGHK